MSLEKAVGKKRKCCTLSNETEASLSLGGEKARLSKAKTVV